MRPFTVAIMAIIMALPAVLHAQTLERIKDTGELRVGYRTDAAPLSHEVDGEPRGYSTVVCKALAPLIGKQLGLSDVEIIFEPVDTKNRFEQVASGDIDLLCGAATITLSRREIVDFSIPTYVDGAALVLRKDAPDSLKELSGQKIGVRSGTTTLEALNKTLKSEEIDAEVVSFVSHNFGMAALENAEIQAYVADQSILMNMVLNSDNKSDLKVFEEILTVEKHGLALAKGDTDFRLAVDRGLSELFVNGTMQKAFENALPGAKPGFGLKAMYLLSPTFP